MYIAVCDDQAEELAVLTDLLERWQNEHRTLLHFKTFLNASELLDAAEKESFTLYLLDIMMPGPDGLSVAREIRSFDATADIVFLTSSPGFAYESYSVHALDYLLKPIRAASLFPVLDKVFQREQQSDESFVLKNGATLTRLRFSQLTHVEVLGKHLYFNLTDGSAREVFGTLSEYEDLLLSRREFMRVHRSYIVNMMQVEEFSPSSIRVYSGKTIPVSRKLYPQLHKEYMKLLFSQHEE